MSQKIILLVVAAVCVGLYFYGAKVKSNYTQYLPIIGGLAFGLNTLIQIAQSEEKEVPLTQNQNQPQRKL